MDSTPVIIEAAINGALTKANNPNVPVSPEEIAADALACFAAGAAIVHNHIDLHDATALEAAERYLAGWFPVLAARRDALLYPTPHWETSLRNDRFVPSFDHLVVLAETGLVRMGAVDPGSVNLGTLDASGVPRGGIVLANSFATVERALDTHRRWRLGPSLGIYEPGFLRTVVAWWKAGELPKGAMVKLYFSADSGPSFASEVGRRGAPFGLPPTSIALDAYLEVLGHCDVPWFVSVVGGDVTRSAVGEDALRRGGHLHVGLEFYGGADRPTNTELVHRAVALCERVGRPIASSAEAAALLDLPRSEAEMAR